MEEIQEISNTLFSNNTLGLIVAGIIFVITVVLVIRKLIGFVLTAIFLFFAIVSGLAIANNDIVRDYLHRKNQENVASGKEDWEAKFNHFKEQVIEKFEDLKKDFSKDETKK